MNRRQFLIASAGAVALPAQTIPRQAFRAGVVPAGAGKPAGDAVRAFWSNCDEVSSLGFRYIEINNTRAEIAEAYASRRAEFKDEMAKRRLTIVGMALFSHIADVSQRTELLAHHLRLGRFLAEVGGSYITHMIAPGAILNEPADTGEYAAVDVKAWAANANEIGQRLFEEHGVRLAYHPEQGEIRTGLCDRILDATDENHFRLLIDTGHIAAGGANPVEMCNKFRARVECVHLKDFKPAAQPSKAGNAPFGEGTVDLPAVAAALRDTKFGGWVMGESGGTNQSMHDYMVQVLQLAI